MRLLYLYLDRGDLDGCASVLDGRVHVRLPGVLPACGSEEAAALLAAISGGGIHRLRKVVAEAADVVVSGVFQPEQDKAGTELGMVKEFVDFFTISDQGLLLSWCRFHGSGP